MFEFIDNNDFKITDIFNYFHILKDFCLYKIFYCIINALIWLPLFVYIVYQYFNFKFIECINTIQSNVTNLFEENYLNNYAS